MVNYYIIGAIVTGFLLLVIIIWLLLRFIKKRKKKKELGVDIPQQMIEDFEEAERRLKTDKNGNSSPYQILWQIARERSGNKPTGIPAVFPAGTSGTITDSKSADGNIQGDRKPEQGRDISLQLDSSNTKEHPSNNETNRSPKINWESFD